MEVTLMQNKSPKNYLNKDISIVKKLQGTFQHEVSLDNPIIRLRFASVPDCNYMYIEKLKRYYFIREVVGIKYGYYELDCVCDYLMTFKTLIENSMIHVTKTDNFNRFINAGILEESRTKSESKEIPIDFNANGQTIMIV